MFLKLLLSRVSALFRNYKFYGLLYVSVINTHVCVKQFLTVNRVNMFWGERYNNQERPNISHGKVLETCVDILGAQPNTILLINKILRMPVNRD